MSQVDLVIFMKMEPLQTIETCMAGTEINSSVYGWD